MKLNYIYFEVATKISELPDGIKIEIIPKPDNKILVIRTYPYEHRDKYTSDLNKFKKTSDVVFGVKPCQIKIEKKEPFLNSRV